MLLQKMSATSSMSAPMTMVSGSRSLWSPPTIMRVACGTMSPTNPMTPQNATQNAVRTAVRTIMRRLKVLASMPRYLAWSSPRSIMLNLLALSIRYSIISMQGTAMIHACSHPTVENEPNSHPEMDLSSSTLNDVTSVVPADSPIAIMEPPRT